MINLDTEKNLKTTWPSLKNIKGRITDYSDCGMDNQLFSIIIEMAQRIEILEEKIK